MREGVQDALNEATESLAAEGFDSAEEVKRKNYAKRRNSLFVIFAGK